MAEELVSLVLSCTRDVGEQEAVELPDDMDGDTVLFGGEGVFDSLALVNLVLAVEEAVEERYEVAVTLADERAMSQSTSPFRSVRSLADYTSRLIEEAN